VAPPAPEPIEFDSNPDVLALRSAISILQMQRARAARDMATLQRAKDAALRDPRAFMADLEGGAVRMGGGAVGGGTGLGAAVTAEDSDLEDSEDSSHSDSDSSGGEDVAMGEDGQVRVKREPGAAVKAEDASASSSSTAKPKTKKKRKRKQPWSDLPTAQNIVRMPPINWSQYAVVGESLDKLHREQTARPAPGAPATLAPDGRYVFPPGPNRRADEVLGIAAPFDALRDRVVDSGAGGGGAAAAAGGARRSSAKKSAAGAATRQG
jgi:hypothetical protein